MAHELMFDPDDPTVVRVREIALALPGAKEKVSVGHPTFYTAKVFCWYGMSYKVDGEWIRQPRSVSVLLPEAERLALLERESVYIPGYIGPSGWVGVKLDDATDWDEMAELIEESFRTTASKKLIRELDMR